MSNENNKNPFRLSESNFNYNQIEVIQNIEKQNQEKEANFLERISAFEKITSLEEAQQLAKNILPVAQEVNRFDIGNAKCTIINRPEQLRITFNSEKEFISYDFA